MKKLYNTIFHIGLVLSFGLVLLFFYWTILDGVYINRVTNLDEIVYQTNKTTYKVGEGLDVSVDGFCKYRDVSANTYINLVDTVYYPYEVKQRSIPVGCPFSIPKLFTSFIVLPQNITGTYHLSGYHLYDINPIRRGAFGIKVSFESNDFTIIK